MNPVPKTLTIALALALALALAGACSGSDDTSDSVGDGGGTGGGGDAAVTSDGGGDRTDGKLGGPCYANGTCDTGLVCEDGVCVAEGSGPAEGEEGGPCYANGTCNAGLECEGGVCVAPDTTGQLGGPCFGNGTCNEGLVCIDDVCQEPREEGTEGGPCREDGSCDPGLICRDGFCVVPRDGEFAWQNPCTDLVADPKTDGETCTDHCQCESGYCYDEGYLDGFRFCTRRCDGFEYECLSEGGVQTDVCLLFSGTWVDDVDPPIHLRNFCVPGCLSDADCESIDAAWSGCQGPNGTMWDGHTVSARKTCVVVGN